MDTGRHKNVVGQSTGKRSERIHVSTSLVVYQREIGAQHQRLKSMSIKVILGNEIVNMTLYYLNEAARALYFDDAAPPPPRNFSPKRSVTLASFHNYLSTAVRVLGPHVKNLFCV